MSKIRTRFLVISDTHNFKYDEDITIPFRSPLPRFDVLLHCGDLSGHYGKEAEDYKNTIEIFKSIDADLKLVIAGNHEVLLDDRDSNPYKQRDDFEDERSKLLQFLGAKENGITYLEEGIHVFNLSHGALLRVYASPYTPLWNKKAVFTYTRDLDRYSTRDQIPAGIETTSIAEQPIPSFPAVDVVMTHGPPHDICDKVHDRNDGGESLHRAVRRAKPLLHCFGHLHPAYGGVLKTWNHVAPMTTESIKYEYDETIANNFSPLSVTGSQRFWQQNLLLERSHLHEAR